MDDLSWAPPGVDTKRANVARVYDFLLGGTHNFEVDRDVARALEAIEPQARDVARANRAFLGRAVRYLTGVGIRQFIDIGSGIPTQGNVHEVAQNAAPDSKVVYVDVDPVAIAHSRAVLSGTGNATIIEGDLRDPEKILADPRLADLIDLSRPVAVLLVASMHFITDKEEPERIVARLRDEMAPGSHLTVSHGTTDGHPPHVVAAVEKLYSRASAPANPRPYAAIHRFFDGFDVIEPGLVFIPLWRPDPATPVPERPEQAWGYAGIGRKA